MGAVWALCLSPFERIATGSRSPAASVRAAVNVQDLARHKGRGFEIEDRVGDLAYLPHPTYGLQARKELVRLGPMHRCLDHAWRDGVHTDAATGVFDCKGASKRIEAALG